MEKYKATATVVWEFESEFDHHKAIEQIKADLSQHLSILEPQKIGVRLDKHKKPKIVILGEFPSEEVLQSLEGITVLRTDLHGWIHLETDGEGMWLEVERDTTKPNP